MNIKKILNKKGLKVPILEVATRQYFYEHMGSVRMKRCVAMFVRVELVAELIWKLLVRFLHLFTIFNCLNGVGYIEYLIVRCGLSVSTVLSLVRNLKIYCNTGEKQ